MTRRELLSFLSLGAGAVGASVGAVATARATAPRPVPRPLMLIDPVCPTCGTLALWATEIEGLKPWEEHGVVCTRCGWSGLSPRAIPVRTA